MKNWPEIDCESIGGASNCSLDGVEKSISTEKAAWYAIQTRVRYERKVSRSLEQKGIDVFIPLIEEVHRWSDRDKAIKSPLFPGYAFARVEISPAVKKAVLLTEGVINFVGCSGFIHPVPSKQIEDLQHLLSQNARCALSPFLSAGKRVRVRGGCLNGVEGIVECSDAKHLTISIEMIQRSIAVDIQGYELELV